MYISRLKSKADSKHAADLSHTAASAAGMDTNI